MTILLALFFFGPPVDDWYLVAWQEQQPVQGPLLDRIRDRREQRNSDSTDAGKPEKKRWIEERREKRAAGELPRQKLAKKLGTFLRKIKWVILIVIVCIVIYFGRKFFS